MLEKTPESPLDSKKIKPVNLKRKSTLNIHWKDWCWSSSMLVTWCRQPTHWKSPWCWERLRAERGEGVRGWDGWMGSLMQWTWTWENFGRWWGIGQPGMLQSMGSQRVCHFWVTEKEQLELKRFILILCHCISGNSTYRYTDTCKKEYIY